MKIFLFLLSLTIFHYSFIANNILFVNNVYIRCAAEACT